LWAIAPASVPAAALLTVPSVPLVFGVLCALAWSRLQLDR
jgi:ABC-2 type transport system permease protein